MQANTITLFQLMLHIHSLCTLNYTKHQMTRKQKKLSQLDEGISNAKLEFSFFCYYKQNLADLIFLNTGLENLKPQFGTGPAPMPHPQKYGVGGGKKIIRESNVSFLHHFYGLVC